MHSFDALRLRYLRENPPPACPPRLDEAMVQSGLTKAELLSRLAEEGQSVSERTLNYYLSLGLLEKPTIAARRQGRGRAGYFSPDAVQAVLRIRRMQAAGLTLQRIARRVNNREFIEEISHDAIDRAYFEHFKELTLLLVNHLPEAADAAALAEYLGVDQPDDMRQTLERAAALVARVRQSVKQMCYSNPLKLKDVSLRFQRIAEPFWEQSLYTLYFLYLSRKSSRRERQAVALLDATAARLGVLLHFFSVNHTVVRLMEDMASARDG